MTEHKIINCEHCTAIIHNCDPKNYCCEFCGGGRFGERLINPEDAEKFIEKLKKETEE